MVVGIVGVGLIGGSVGMALRQCAVAESVVGFDSDPDVLREAQRRGAICASATDFARLRDLEVCVVATPPRATIPVIEQLTPFLSPDALVMDCTSLKSPIERGVPDALHSRFVGGHPMSGKAVGGIRSADPAMFEDAPWILCPHPDTDPALVRRAETIVFGVGARPVRMDARTHDRHVALQSHLPHVLAFTLRRMMVDGAYQDISAGSWADLTRVGHADPVLWREILSMNGGEVSHVIDDMIDVLRRFQKAAAEADESALDSLMRVDSVRE